MREAWTKSQNWHGQPLIPADRHVNNKSDKIKKTTINHNLLSLKRT